MPWISNTELTELRRHLTSLEGRIIALESDNYLRVGPYPWTLLSDTRAKMPLKAAVEAILNHLGLVVEHTPARVQHETFKLRKFDEKG